MLEGRGTDVGDIVKYYDRYLRIGDPLPNKPFLQLFWDKEFSEEELWFNSNVQGSYAVSSLRDKSPLVACLVSRSTPYKLRDKHSKIASEVFLKGAKLSPIAVATAIFRDFGFKGQPTDSILIDAFREQLGFPTGSPDFESLFDANDGFTVGTVQAISNEK